MGCINSLYRRSPVVARYGLKALVWPCVGMLIGILIAGIQLVPTMFLWSETARSAGVLIENRAEWALSLWRLPELIAPGFFSGTPGESLVASVYMWLGNPGTRFPIPFSTSIFAGTTVIVLAAYGTQSNRTTRALGIAGAVFLWIALGPVLGGGSAVEVCPRLGFIQICRENYRTIHPLPVAHGRIRSGSHIIRSSSFVCLCEPRGLSPH